MSDVVRPDTPLTTDEIAAIKALSRDDVPAMKPWRVLYVEDVPRLLATLSERDEALARLQSERDAAIENEQALTETATALMEAAMEQSRQYSAEAFEYTRTALAKFRELLEECIPILIDEIGESDSGLVAEIRRALAEGEGR